MRATTRFAAGPAMVTRTSSRRRRRKFDGLIMTGLPQPMKAKLPWNTKMLIMGMSSVPTGSMCARGLSVTRPSERGVSSPSRSATMAWPHSWNPRLTTSVIRMISPLRMKMGSMSMRRSFSRARGQLGNQLLLLRLQGRIGHRREDLAGPVGLSHVQEHVRLLQAHHLALDLGLRMRLEPFPGLEPRGPVGIPHVAERLGVPVAELDPGRGKLGGPPEGLLHRVVLRR